MYIVMTRVKLKPDSHRLCAEIFKRTNPELVKGEPDWLGARMIFDPDTDEITVLAHWRSVESYKRLSASPAFQKTMHEFGPLFAAPPIISVNSLLVDMTPT